MNLLHQLLLPTSFLYEEIYQNFRWSGSYLSVYIQAFSFTIV